MKIVIIEDEEFAARRLESMIIAFDSTIQIVAKLESVVDSVSWFQNNQIPDLIFMDIHLEDNLSFAIFDSISIQCPVIFTTATDELSTRMFQQKKIDFLLKPIAQSELEKLILKYRDMPVEHRKTIDGKSFADNLKKL